MPTSHTPAPWRYNKTYGLVMYGKLEVAALHSGNAANARLIAAAPEMLAALQRLTHPMADDSDLEHALEVIARATGAA